MKGVSRSRLHVGDCKIKPLIITQSVGIVAHEEMVILSSSPPKGAVQVATLKARVKR